MQAAAGIVALDLELRELRMYGMRMLGSWILALFLAAMFILIANEILFPDTPEENVVFPALVAYSGMSLWEPTGRFLIGIMHPIAALLLFIPWTRRLGAMFAILLSGGALVAHLLWLGTELPVQLDSPAGETDGGILFYLAISLFVASIALFIIHPKHRH